MEYFALYTKDREQTHKIIKRGTPLPPKLLSPCGTYLYFQHKGKQRQPFKADWSNLWGISTGNKAGSRKRDHRYDRERYIYPLP